MLDVVCVCVCEYLHVSETDRQTDRQSKFEVESERRTLRELVAGGVVPLGWAGPAHAERERDVLRVLERLEIELEARARREPALLRREREQCT